MRKPKTVNVTEVYKGLKDSSIEFNFELANIIRVNKGYSFFIEVAFPYLFKGFKNQAIRQGYDFTYDELQEYRQEVYCLLLEYPKHVETSDKLKGVLTFKVKTSTPEKKKGNIIVQATEKETTYKYALKDIPNSETINKILFNKLITYCWGKIRRSLPKTIESTIYSDMSVETLNDSISQLEGEFLERLNGIEIDIALQSTLTKNQYQTLVKLLEGERVTATKTKNAIRERILNGGYTREDIESFYQYYLSLKVIEKNLPLTI